MLSIIRVKTRTVLVSLVREVRIAQVDAQNIRLVMELAPGYGVSPQNTIVRSDLPSRWSITLRSINRGVVTLDREVGVGSCFTVILPQPDFRSGDSTHIERSRSQ